jgi:Ca-activated chloride channel family protein
VSPDDRSGGDEIAFVKVRYKEPTGTQSRLIDRPVEVRDEEPSVDFRFAAAVAGFGMILRDSEHRGSITTEQVLRLAERGLGADRQGYRRGFLDLVHSYRRLGEATDRDGG